MSRFLYSYLELLSYFGEGTPENPGGDFGMYCWIEATDTESALEWGYVLLGQYCKARYTRSTAVHRHDGSPIRAGEIVEDPETLQEAQQWNIPSCKVGEIPDWREPWRHTNIG
jgi:hypothetical protein